MDQEAVCVSFVKLPDEKDSRRVVLIKGADGTTYINDGTFASELIVEKRAREGIGWLDWQRWNGKRYEGGLAALGSSLDEVNEELDRIQKEMPDQDVGEYLLGLAVEITSDGEIIFYDEDFGIWKKMKPQVDVDEVLT